MSSYLLFKNGDNKNNLRPANTIIGPGLNPEAPIVKHDKKDLSKAFYYDAMGTLRYVDFIEGEYPDYPYYAIPYRVSGSPVSVIYYASKDSQYLYKPDETFVGLWYKYNLYDKHSKVILKRTSY